MKRTKLQKKLLILVLVPLLLQVCFAMSFYFQFERFERIAANAALSRELIGRCNWLIYTTVSALTAWMAYSASGQSIYKTLSRHFNFVTRENLNDLAVLCQDNEQMAAPWLKLRTSTESVLNSVSEATDAKTWLAKRTLANLVWGEIPGYRSRLLEAADSRVKLSAQELPNNRNSLKLTILTAMLVNLICAAIASIILVKDIGRRIGRLAENSARLAREESLLPAVSGNDELTSLDQQFRLMADELSVLLRRERSVAYNSAEGICTVNSDLCLTQINPSGTKLFGINQEELINQSLGELLSESALSNFKALMSESSENLVQGSWETKITRADGRAVDTLWSVSWAATDKSFYCVIHDETERKEAENLKAQVLHMISHDIRTPLMTVTGSMEFIKMRMSDTLAEQDQKVVARGLVACSNLLKMAGDLLELEKISTGNLLLDSRAFNIGETILDAFDTTSGPAEQSKISLVCEERAERVFGDPDRICQVLVNLLGNAIKFSPASSTIKVTTETVGEFVEVRVIDQGPGIAEDKLTMIFDRFKQAKSSDSKMHKGVGLGLAICKGIVEQHGGKIWCESRPGEGASFVFTILRAEPDQIG